MKRLDKIAWKGSAKRLGACLDELPPEERDARALDGAMRYALLGRKSRNVELLLARGADPLRLGCEGDNLLAHAAIGGDPALVRQMLDLGCDPNHANVNGRTALINAARSGRADAVRVLLAAGADVNRVPLIGDAALLESLTDGHGEETPLALIEAGADIRVRARSDGRSALHLAASRGYLAVVRALLDRGADPNATGGHAGEYPLAAAARSGNPEVVGCLLAAGAGPLAVDGNGATVLSGAATRSVDLVRTLLDAAPDLVQMEHDGRTVLDGAATAGNYPVVDLLLERGAPVQAATELGRSALVTAAIFGRLEILERLVAHPATAIDYRAGARGMTALMCALGSRDGDGAAEMLLAAGASIEVRDRDGLGALCHAVRGGSPRMVERLLDLGRPVDDRAPGGITPLMRAAGNRESLRGPADRIAVIDTLLAHGADVSARDDRGRTALVHVALDRGAAAAGSLLRAGADVNAADRDGNTLLALAVAYGSYDDRYRRPRSRGEDVTAELIELLLDAGADPNLGGPEGRTLRLAEGLRCTHVVRLLRARGAIAD